MSKLKLKKNKISDNKLSLKLYYHPDWAALTKQNQNEMSSKMQAKNATSCSNSISIQYFSPRTSYENVSLFPTLNTSTDQNKISNIEKNTKNFKLETELTKQDGIMDETVNDVLYSLQNLRMTTNSTLLADECSRDFSKLTHKKQQKPKEKITTDRTDSLYQMQNGLKNRLNYLFLMNPNPETKLPKIKPTIQVSSFASLGVDNSKLELLSKISRQVSKKSARNKIKQKTNIWNNNSNKIKFFSEMNVDQFLIGFLENLKYLERIKNNKKIVAGILQTFLEYSDDIGSLLLSEDKKDIRKNLTKEKIKDHMQLHKNDMIENTQNDENYDMDLLIKLYYFNQSLQRYLEELNFESSSYQNEKYNEALEKFQKIQEEYLINIKYRNYNKYQKSQNLLKNNEIAHKDHSLDVLKHIESLESSIGKLSSISAKTRLMCKYAEDLVEGRNKNQNYGIN